MNDLGFNYSRKSGILMPFRALPGDHDFQGTYGEEATAFLYYAKRAGFGIVHDLPFSPPDPFGSPYSPDSAFAIDTSRIDLNQLAYVGDLSCSDIDTYQSLAQTGNAGHEQKHIKEVLVAKASKNFSRDGSVERQDNFAEWCDRESRWLDSYAAYSILKKLPENTKGDNWRWQNWEYGKNYNQQLVEDVRAGHPEEFFALCYGQWIVEEQTRQYLGVARQLGVQVWGDVPFYTGHGEVWAHRELFNLDADGFQINQGGADKSVSSETGQTWGFATYKVDDLQDQDQIDRLVSWWSDRLIRAYELSFGKIRVDHFIGWAEPYILAADAQNGLGGYRDKGIGRHLLTALRDRFGRDLPIYPEDLGAQTEKTPELRDEFNLFANTLAVRGFTKCLPNGEYKESIHNPQNYRRESVSFSTNHDMATLVATMDRSRTRHPAALEDYIAYEKAANPFTDIHRETSSLKLAQHVMKRIMDSRSAYAIMWVGDILQGGEEWQYNVPNTVQGNIWSRRMSSNDMLHLNEHASFWYHLNESSGRSAPTIELTLAAD